MCSGEKGDPLYKHLMELRMLINTHLLDRVSDSFLQTKYAIRLFKSIYDEKPWIYFYVLKNKN